MKKVLVFITIFVLFMISAEAKTGTVICTGGDTSDLSVRSSVGGTWVGGLACNSKVEILSEKGSYGECSKWYQIRQGIITGYSCGNYIIPDEEENEEEGTVLCIEDTSPLNIWSDINKSSKLKSLNCDASLTVIEKDIANNSKCTNWYKVKSGTTTGYACGKYISTSSNTGGQTSTNPNIGKSTKGDNIYQKENYSSPPSGDGTISCYEDTGDVSLRSTPGGGSVNGKGSCGEVVKINSVKEGSGTCGYYYNITNSKGQSGYVCGYFINTTKLSSTALAYYNNHESLESYYTTLRNKKFPESYLPYLAEIHARHPNWEFNADIINLNFSDVVSGESAYGRNLLEGTYFNQNYYGMDLDTYNILTDTFTEYPTEEGWYNVSSEAVAFYLDPRNYLNEKYIFAFESLDFDSQHTSNTVSKILASQTFWPTVYQNFDSNVYDDIITATEDIGISAVHIASRIKQEISGVDISDPRLGGTFTYEGQNYSGYYNFFNIKVYGTNKIVNGMVYAKNNGWNTPYNGIYGGTSFIYNEYAGIGQDTMYYEKFDVSTTDGHYTHQYMQNLAAAVQETNTTFNTYVTTLDGYLDNNISFTIPVYNNMSSYAVTSPKLGNPNNYLKDLTIDGKTINGFSYDKYSYNVNLPADSKSIKVDASKINSGASITGTGNITIDSNEKKINITVTAASGRQRTYTINITRDEAPKEDEVVKAPEVNTILNSSGIKYNGNNIFGIDENTSIEGLIKNIEKVSSYASVSIKDSKGSSKSSSSTFKTGDIVTISNSKETKTFNIVIYGDINGTGKIDKDDCLAILRQINGYTKLDGAYKTAADANKDGKIDKDDCLAILRHMNNYTNLNK